MAPATKPASQTRHAEAPAAAAAPPKTADGALLDKIVDEASRNLDTLAARYTKELAEPGMGALRRAMLLGQALSRLEAALTDPMLDLIMTLQNSQLGFLTDKTEGYDRDTVKRCTIQGLLEGVFPFGNEWNIISGKCYIAKEGYKRKVNELSGLTDPDVRPGIPRVDKETGHTIIRVAAEWTWHGKRQTLIGADGKPGRVFAVTSRSGATADNLIGKAERKAYRAIWLKATGASISPPDGAVDDPPDPTPADPPEPTLPESRRQLEREALAADLAQATAEADTASKCKELLATLDREAEFLGKEASAQLRMAMEKKRLQIETGGTQ